jgi:hypothetical protein
MVQSDGVTDFVCGDGEDVKAWASKSDGPILRNVKVDVTLERAARGRVWKPSMTQQVTGSIEHCAADTDITTGRKGINGGVIVVHFCECNVGHI